MEIKVLNHKDGVYSVCDSFPEIHYYNVTRRVTCEQTENPNSVTIREDWECTHCRDECDDNAWRHDHPCLDAYPCLHIRAAQECPCDDAFLDEAIALVKDAKKKETE